MPEQLIGLNTASLQGGPPRSLADLPHGLVAPPERVRQVVVREEERLLREPRIAPTPEARQRLVNDLTLQYHFESQGYEVLYRARSAW